MKRNAKSGYSLVELMVVVAILIVLMAMAIPQMVNFMGSYRLSGAAREISGQISLARMRAAAGFTQAKFTIDTVGETYQISTCTTKNTGTGGCTTWTSEGGTQNLPPGVTFGYGSISTPAGSQSTIAQSTTFLFNSRGVAIDTSTYSPTTQDALYLTSGSGRYYAVTVSTGGKPTVYVYTSSGWKEM